jgi:methyl-accepting chemotaxis protein
MESNAAPATRRRRRRWLVKPRYQIFFALVLVLFQIDVGLIYLAVTQHHARRVAEAAPDLQHFLDADLWFSGLPLVVAVSLIMGMVVYLLGLRFSNQIVGPLPRLSATLRAMAQGDYSQRLKFRPGDALEELAADVNHLAESLERKAHGAQPLSADTATASAPQLHPAAAVRTTAPAR